MRHTSQRFWIECATAAFTLLVAPSLGVSEPAPAVALSPDASLPTAGVVVAVPGAGEMMALDPDEWRGIHAERDAGGHTTVGCDHADSEHDEPDAP